MVVPIRSALELTLESIGLRESRNAISKEYPENARASYAIFISHSEGPIKIVAGEADTKLFERDDMISALRGVLACTKATLSLIFHRYADKGVAEKSLAESNKRLISLKHEFDERVHLYWSPIRPRQHFAVITVNGGNEALLEEPNHEGEQPFWATPVYDKAEAKDWAVRFDKFVRGCKELEFAVQPTS